MEVKQRSGGQSVGYYLYKLVAPNTPVTQVVTGVDAAYEEGMILAVALQGVQLKDGTRVGTVFDFGAMSCGKILGTTNELIGSRILGHSAVA